MLTENQQQLIDQITQEFISHNKSKQATRGESLLGVDDIINSIQHKRDGIARIKAYNEAILEALKPIFEDNFEALSYELNALGLSLKSNHEWLATSQGLTFVNMKVAMHHDRNSLMDFYFDAQVSYRYSNWSEIFICNPKLQYSYAEKIYSFEELCKAPEFVNRIKNMYERKTK